MTDLRPVYDVDGITIYHADCADILPGIDPGSVDLLLTDPPYGINLDTDYSKMSGSTRTYTRVEGDDNSFDPADLLPFGRCILFGANHYASRLPDSSGWIVWDKRAGKQASNFMSDAELAWCRGVAATGMVFVYRHMWKGAFRDSERGDRLHPTQKPVALMRWILEQWTEPGDLILDPYMGSGPIARACADLGRRYIGIEIVEEYVDAAINRLGQTTFDLTQP